MPLLWVACAAFAQCSIAAVLSDDFEVANRLYEQGNYQAAVAGYERIVDSGRASSAVYYNLGNALFKTGQKGRAIAAYRGAARLAPRDPDLRANLQFVLNQVQGPTLPPNRWRQWLSHFTLNEWTAATIVPLWLWFLLLSVQQLRPDWKPSLNKLTMSLGIVWVMLAAGLGAAWVASTTPTAIVTADNVLVRTGPLDEAQSAFTVQDGSELALLDRKDDWVQVSLGDRRVGWVKRSQVILRPAAFRTPQ